MRLIAHRGGRGFGVDNTLEAMDAAVRAGVRRMETDVRVTADGRLLICHDSVIWNHLVARTTYEELAKHAPERPLLSEMLERLSGWVSFNIEVKEAPAAPVGEMLEQYRIEADTLVSSFQGEFLRQFKSLYPGVRTGYLYRVTYSNPRKLFQAAQYRADVVLPYFHSIDKGLVEHAHRLGLDMYAWTVNNEDDLWRLVDWGVDGIITDRYLEVRELLEGRSIAVD